MVLVYFQRAVASQHCTNFAVLGKVSTTPHGGLVISFHNHAGKPLQQWQWLSWLLFIMAYKSNFNRCANTAGELNKLDDTE